MGSALGKHCVHLQTSLDTRGGTAALHEEFPPDSAPTLGCAGLTRPLPPGAGLTLENLKQCCLCMCVSLPFFVFCSLLTSESIKS